MLERRVSPSPVFAILSPVLAVLLTVMAGYVLFALMGKDPVRAMEVYFLSPFADAYNRSELLVKAIPLALIGSGLAVCFRAGVFNIGAPGQYTLGAIFAGGVALYAPEGSPMMWLLPLCLAAGVLGGMLWGWIPAILRLWSGANIILVSLMLTYVAALLLDWLVRGPWNDPEGRGFPKTASFPDGAIMPILLPGTRLHWGLALAVVAALALTWMLYRSHRGFAIRTMGMSPKAATFGGFSEGRTITAVMLISGGLAGLAGAVEATSTIQQLQPDISAGYGFAAIIVAFLGRLNPIGSLIAALALAVTYIGGENAQIMLKLPKNAAFLFQGMLLFFLLACDTLVNYRLRVRRRAGV